MAKEDGTVRENSKERKAMNEGDEDGEGTRRRNIHDCCVVGVTKSCKNNSISVHTQTSPAISQMTIESVETKKLSSRVARVTVAGLHRRYGFQLPGYTPEPTTQFSGRKLICYSTQVISGVTAAGSSGGLQQPVSTQLSGRKLS